VIPVDDEKIIDIQEKLAHQEHMLASLNEALTNQQAQISKLEALCQSLAEKIRALSEADPEDDEGEERPPHY
jgi:SlyX protein